MQSSQGQTNGCTGHSRECPTSDESTDVRNPRPMQPGECLTIQRGTPNPKRSTGCTCQVAGAPWKYCHDGKHDSHQGNTRQHCDLQGRTGEAEIEIAQSRPGPHRPGTSDTGDQRHPRGAGLETKCTQGTATQSRGKQAAKRHQAARNVERNRRASQGKKEALPGSSRKKHKKCTKQQSRK